MPTIAKRRTRSESLTSAPSTATELPVALHARVPLSSPNGQSSNDGGLPLTVAEWRSVSAYLALSKRESEVARLVLDDASESDIAVRLAISRKTVHAHVERLYRKLKVHSRHQLVTRLFKAYIAVVTASQLPSV